MTPEQLFSEIVQYCQAHSNEEIVKKYARYFKGGWDAYGLTQEVLHAKVDEILMQSWINLELVMKTSLLLVQRPKYEETSFAMVLIKRYSRQYTREIFNLIGRWFEIGIRNWAHTDMLCSEIISVLYKKSIIHYTDLAPWRQAGNKFQRRAVPVSMIKLLKESKGFEELFQFIDPMMMDPEREVHQGLGWFLREAWKIRDDETESFLLRWKDQAPRLIFQYATEKMTSQEKARFKKEK